MAALNGGGPEPSEVAKAATHQCRWCWFAIAAAVTALVIRGLVMGGGGDDVPELPERLPTVLRAIGLM
ncbi:MAG: hypothetical protein F4Y25_02010 [Chloroflexi bacterium]|nr:hypothetical protein [Chloroflexota bacterium]